MGWIEDIDAAGTGRVTSSSNDGEIVSQGPASLLAKAREHYPSLTMDEYTLARILASEYNSGSAVELAAIADADVNKANRRGLSIFRHATGNRGRFGKQGSSRLGTAPVSTRLDPRDRHVVAAMAVIRPQGASFLLTGGGPARGISRGAERYFDPHAQQSASGGRCTSSHAPPLKILEKWTYALSWARRSSCTLGTKRGGSQQEWVGAIAGIDAWELMLFRPATGMQDENFKLAQRVIESKGKDQPAPSLSLPGQETLTLALIAVGALAAGGFIG